MNNIEEDIKRCRELIKINHSNWIGLSNQKAIEHILTDYEKQKQEKEKWKELYLDKLDKTTDIVLEFNNLLKEVKELESKLERQKN